MTLIAYLASFIDYISVSAIAAGHRFFCYEKIDYVANERISNANDEFCSLPRDGEGVAEGDG